MLGSDNTGINRINLLASSFSGATLFGIMLCQDRRFIGFGDTYLVPGISDKNNICNCGDTVAACQFRLKLSEQLKSRQLPEEMILNRQYCIPSTTIASRFGGTRIAGIYRRIGKTLGYHRAFSTFLKRELGFLESLSKLGGYHYYLDGSKNIVRADIFTEINPSNQIIHLVRDPIAVLHSTATRHADRGRSLKFNVASWINYNIQAQKLCSLHPDRSALILFDDLISDPDAVLATLASKLGWNTLDVTPNRLDPKLTHIIGNRSRHKATKVRAKQLKPSADDLIALGATRQEIDQICAVYENMRQAV